jgi:protein required for attachment to host cells
MISRQAHRFARRVASALEELTRSRHIEAVLIAAPPRTFAELRRFTMTLDG